MADSLDTCSSCGGDVGYVRLEENGNNVTLQVGSSRHDTIETVSKNSSQASVGISFTGPSVKGKYGNSSEVKSATSDIDNASVNIPLESGPTVIWVENPDPNNDDVISGCTTDDCDNNISDKIDSRREFLNNVSQDIEANKNIEEQDVANALDRKSSFDFSNGNISDISSANKSKDKGIVGRSAAKAKESAGTAVSKARSGASSAITRSRDGINNTVQRVKQWYGDDAVPEQTSDPAHSPEPETTETTIRISPGDTAPSTSNTNGNLTMAFGDGTDTDPTVLHVAATGDKQVPISSTEGEFSTTLDNGKLRLSPGTDETVRMAPGTDGSTRFLINDGSTVNVTPGDDDTDVVTGNDGDFHMAFGESHTTDGPTTEPDNSRAPEPDASQATGSNTKTTGSNTKTTGSNNTPTNDPDNSQDNVVPEAFRDQKPTGVTWKSEDEIEEIRQQRGVGNGTPEQDATEKDDHSEPSGSGPR